LRRAAIALMSVVLTQVTLGVAAFTLQLLDMENTPAGIASTVLHVLTGSLTLAASLVLAIQVQRHVRRKGAAA
jgi:heme A synthase